MKNALFVVIINLIGCTTVLSQETLHPIKDGDVPKTFEELWAGFDPRIEPLEIEILKEWEEDEVVMRIVRFRIGIFKGQKAMMAGVYGFPKGDSKLPGLLQIHGGGQYADYRAVISNAKRGYSTISISWAGRINAPDFIVDPEGVKLFWDNMTNDPNYKLTTDWGLLDAYHAPHRNPQNGFAHVKPAEWTLDSVESPRNNPWFLCTLGARRAITFLEQQPEVDPNKLGVYGHSMGGKLTIMTAAADNRVKAAAPSCGGISNRPSDNVLYSATIHDGVNLKHISCPVLFQSPSNDFHGHIDDLQKAVTEIQSSEWRVTCSPHHNHQDTPEYEVVSQLWFDQHLKGIFRFPTTPQIEVHLKTKDGIPTVAVKPDQSKPIRSVEVFYTRQGQTDGLKDDRDNTKNRFWHYAETKKDDETWYATLPLSNTDQFLWVYANVTYPLDKPVSYAGYYYRVNSSSEFNLSSLMFMATADELKEAGVQSTIKPLLTIETFEGDWEKQWFTYKPEEWGRRTHKIYDELWKAPAGAKLAIEVKSEQDNKLVAGIDTYAAEVELSGGSEWEFVVFSPDDFKDVTGAILPDWEGIRELRLGASDTLRKRIDGINKSVIFGAKWKGPDPKFRNLRWITE